MKLNLDELHTLREALGIANTHVNNDVVGAEYAGERSGLEEFLEKIEDLQKQINKTIVRKRKQSFKKSKVELSDDWIDFI